MAVLEDNRTLFEILAVLQITGLEEPSGRCFTFIIRSIYRLRRIRIRWLPSLLIF